MNKAPKASPELDEARLRQQAIGARLRQLFDDVVNEPVPEDFLDILRGGDPPGGMNGHAQGADPKRSDDAG